MHKRERHHSNAVRNSRSKRLLIWPLYQKHIKVPMILNPAPYQPLPASVVEAFRYITPNETEAETVQKRVRGRNGKESNGLPLKGKKAS